MAGLTKINQVRGVIMATKKHRPPALRLVPGRVCAETIEALEHLLEEARAGTVIGLAVGVCLTGSRFFVDAFGDARRRPLEARGMVCSLDDELGRLVHEMKDT
jgi:hypothetical protein